MPEPKSAHYRKIATTCIYCGRAVTVLRVTVMDDGTVHVATMCERDARGEQEETAKTMHVVEGTGDFIAKV